jgi:hypothetical protein
VVPTLDVKRKEPSGNGSARSTGAQSISLQHSRGYQSCADAAGAIKAAATRPSFTTPLLDQHVMSDTP